jgi:predicted PurR-regulated permease PerM
MRYTSWIWAGALLLLAATVYFFSTVVAYILIAWVLSLLARPIMAFFLRYARIGKWRMGFSGAALATMLVFLGFFLSVLLAFVPTITEQARHLANANYEELVSQLQQPVASVDVKLQLWGLLAKDKSIVDEIESAMNTMVKPELLGHYISGLLGAAGSLLVGFVSVAFMLFFFLKDNNLFLDIVHALVPDNMESKVREAVKESGEVLTRYFGAIIIQITLFSLLMMLCLWLLGVPNSIIIGAFGGIVNIIPYLGPIIGVLFGCAISLTSCIDTDLALAIPMILKIAISFFGIHFLDSNILAPTIFSRSVQAHPLEIFIIILMSATLGGITGMVLGIPIYTVLRVIGRTFFNHLKVVQKLTDHLE